MKVIAALSVAIFVALIVVIEVAARVLPVLMVALLVLASIKIAKALSRRSRPAVSIDDDPLVQQWSHSTERSTDEPVDARPRLRLVRD